MKEVERFAELEREYEDVLAELSKPEVAADRGRSVGYSRRLKALEPVVRTVRALRGAADDVVAAREMVGDAPPDERELAKSQHDADHPDDQARPCTQRVPGEVVEAELEAELGRLLVPRDENDGRNVIVTIRGAEGGDEANLFAGDLYHMYLRYADHRHWRVEVLSIQASDLGGIDEVTFLVNGDRVPGPDSHLVGSRGGPARGGRGRG